MSFQKLHERLVRHIRSRVSCGQITERRLARLTGVSQPHLHNVLKGARLLSPAMADRLLSQLQLSVLDLMAQGAGAMEVPLLEGVIGPDHEFPKNESGTTCTVPLASGRLLCPAMVRLGMDPCSEPLFLAGDMALVERAAAVCLKPAEGCWYVVEIAGRGFVRGVQVAGERLELITPNRGKRPARDCILLREQHILEVVKAKLIWIGRHLEPSPIAPRPIEKTGRENQ